MRIEELSLLKHCHGWFLPQNRLRDFIYNTEQQVVVDNPVKKRRIAKFEQVLKKKNIDSVESAKSSRKQASRL